MLAALCYKAPQRMGPQALGAVCCTLGRCALQLATTAKFKSRETQGNHRLLVQVRDNNVDQALKALKKKMQREGIFREMKLRNYYEKPSEKRVREQAEAVRRARKLARKKAQREGLLPGKAAAARPGAPGAKPGGRPGGPGRPSGGGGGFRSGGGGFGGPR
jgi:small subunit ribosomal protein S21